MKIHKLIVTCIIYCFTFQLSQAQSIQNTAFGDGEELTFVGSYYMSSLWTDIAQVTLKVTEITSAKSPVLRLRGTANTFTSWDSYFKVRDSYQSWVNPVSIKPLIFKRDMYEGGYTKDLKYIFNRKNNTAKSIEVMKDGKVKEKNVKITSETYDLVSAVYYLRNLDFPAYAVNKTIPVTVLIDNKMETVYATYKGKVNVDFKQWGSISCYKIAVSLKDDKLLKGKDSNFIYLTADKNRVPVLIKAQIPVGSIQVRLTDMKGLKN